MGIESNYGHQYRLLPDYWSIGMAGVDLFFVISGFVMVTITRGKFQSSYSVLCFLSHRVARIYPLYWLFSLAVLALFLARPDLVKRSLSTDIDVLGSFLLLPHDGATLLMVGWTLVHEMYFYLVFALMLILPERRLPLYLLFWAGFVITANLLLIDTQNATLRVLSHPLTLEFIAGCLVALLIYRGITRAGILCVTGGILVWMLGFFLHIHIEFGLEPSAWFRVLLFGLPAVLVVYGLVALEVHQRKLLPNWMVKLGDASYSIYLSHVLVIGALARIGALMQISHPAYRTAALLALIVVAIGAGMACYRFIEAPMIHASRRFVHT